MKKNRKRKNGALGTLKEEEEERRLSIREKKSTETEIMHRGEGMYFL